MSVKILFFFQFEAEVYRWDVLSLRGLLCFQMIKRHRTMKRYLSVDYVEEGGCWIRLSLVLVLYKDK
jgi:hypothetical protein